LLLFLFNDTIVIASYTHKQYFMYHVTNDPHSHFECGYIR